MDESKLSDRVLKHLEWVVQKPVACTMLTAEQAECVFPRRSRIQFDALFRWALPKPKAKPKPKPKAGASTSASSSSHVALDDAPISSRTRKKKGPAAG